MLWYQGRGKIGALTQMKEAVDLDQEIKLRLAKVEFDLYGN